MDEELILMKIAGYRNYSSLEDKILQAYPEWTSNPNNLTNFLNDTLIPQGGQGNEAIEIALQFANKEIRNNNGVPVSMIIIIGDAIPNTVEDVKTKREGANKNPNYWEETKEYKIATHWKTEIESIKAADVPVHSFYVEKNDTVQEGFKQLSENGGKGGKCAYLNITDEVTGQEQLKDFFKKLIVFRATEINFGPEAAKNAVKHIKVSFT